MDEVALPPEPGRGAVRAVEALEARAHPGGDVADRVVELRRLDLRDRVRGDGDLDPLQPVRTVAVVVGVSEQDEASAGVAEAT